MKLGFITIYVRDLDSTVRFYTEIAALSVLNCFNPGFGEIAFLGNAEGETMLEFIEMTADNCVSAKGMTLCFESMGQLSAIREKAKELGYSPSEIINQPPRPKCFTVLDPNGMEIEFTE